MLAESGGKRQSDGYAGKKLLYGEQIGGKIFEGKGEEMERRPPRQNEANMTAENVCEDKMNYQCIVTEETCRNIDCSAAHISSTPYH